MTEDRIKELADKWRLFPTDNAWDEVMGFAYDLIAEEREAIIKWLVDEGFFVKDGPLTEAIRARGEK